MRNYREQFKGKKITVMGLGLLGRGVKYTKFLAECGADLIVTDLKTNGQLAVSIKELAKYPGIKYVLGEHRLEDFRDRDMIIKSAGVPLDSPYIKEAKKNKIPVEMDVSLFANIAPEVMIIGVTGTRGKSMTTTLIYKILKDNEKLLGRSVYVGGNLRGLATLPLLKKVQSKDILVCELDSWQLQGFGDAKISPHISVFTSFMPDHMNYYKDDMKKYFSDKANIFKYQNKNDILIIRPGMKKFIKKKDVKGKFIVINTKETKKWKFSVPGIHHRENMTCAVEVSKQLDIPLSNIKKSIESFKDLEGRLQLLRVHKNIKIYNDNNSTTPDATIAGIEALKDEGNIILICGGSDKNLPLENFVKTVNKYCKAVVLIPGSGTERLKSNKLKIKLKTIETKDIKEAVKTALGLASRGDVILFSPAFASFGVFNNEYERNDLFMKVIKGLK